MTRRMLTVGALLAVAAGLRFWRLGAEPLWSDEVVTVLVSLGHRFDSLPLDQVWDPRSLERFVGVDPHATLSSVAEGVRLDSTHPPLFVWLEHLWLRLTWSGSWDRLAWQARVLPACLSLAWVAVMAWAGSATRSAGRLPIAMVVGVMAAVSPMAVYQAQQNRYYALAALILGVATAGHLALMRDLESGRVPRMRAVGVWASASVLGFYVQYLLPVVWLSQVFILIAWTGRRRAWRQVIAPRLVVALLVTPLAWALWIPVVLGHISRPEVEWIGQRWTPAAAVMDVLYVVPGALWVFAGLPLRDGVTPAAVIGTVALGVAGILLWRTGRGAGRVDPQAATTARWCLAQAGVVATLLVAVGWVTSTALTATLRYSFLLLAPLILAAGSWTMALDVQRRRLALAVFVMVGLAGSIMSAGGLLFPQPREPGRTAAGVAAASRHELALVWRAEHLNDVADGLAVALATYAHDDRTTLRFIREPGGQVPSPGLLAGRDVWLDWKPEPDMVRTLGCGEVAADRHRLFRRSLYHVTCTAPGAGQDSPRR